MYKFILFIFFILSFDLNAKYKNTNGEEIDKSIKDLIRWQRNQKKPILAYIDISNDWRNINLETEDNYLIWIGHSTFLIKKMPEYKKKRSQKVSKRVRGFRGWRPWGRLGRPNLFLNTKSMPKVLQR